MMNTVYNLKLRANQADAVNVFYLDTDFSSITDIGLPRILSQTSFWYHLISEMDIFLVSADIRSYQVISSDIRMTFVTKSVAGQYSNF